MSMNSSPAFQLPRQRMQEDVFCLLCTFGKLSPCVFQSQTHVGKPAPGTVTSLRVWAEVTWGVLPSTVCVVPEFQSRLHFSNAKPRRIWEITCPDPELSYLSMFHSCSLELFPSWICQLTICRGAQFGMLHGFPQNISALPVSLLTRWPRVKSDEVPEVLLIKPRRWVHIAHPFLFSTICRWPQANVWALGPHLSSEGLGKIELRAPPNQKVHWLCGNFFFRFIYFTQMYVWAPCVSLLLAEVRRGHQMP